MKMSPQGAVPCGDIRVFEKSFQPTIQLTK